MNKPPIDTHHTGPMPDVLQAMSPLELLRLQSAVLDELMRREVVRSRNNPTGDYGEWIVAEKLKLKLERNSSKGFDATDGSGNRYQIKSRHPARGQTAPLLSVMRQLADGHFDFLIAVVFDADWNIAYAAQIPHERVSSLCAFRDHVNGHQMRFSRSVLGLEGVQDITAKLTD